MQDLLVRTTKREQMDNYAGVEINTSPLVRGFSSRTTTCRCWGLGNPMG